jgi:hypothetical protein
VCIIVLLLGSLYGINSRLLDGGAWFGSPWQFLDRLLFYG